MDMVFTFPEGARVDGVAGPFIVRTDQPPNATAPSPFTLFLASIGACAGVYVQAFCRKRGIDPTDIRIVQRNHTSPQGIVEKIAITIELPSDFPEQYREAVVRVADRCIVKEHLMHPPRIAITAAVPVGA